MTNIFKDCISDLVRHKLSSIVIAVVIALCIFCLATISTVLVNINKLEKRWSEDLRVIIFPTKDIENRENLLKEINSIEGIAKMQYVSSEEAAGIIRKRFPDEDIIFSSNVMPDFIEITVNSSFVESVVGKLKKNQNIDDVIVNYSWLKSLKEVLSVVRYSSMLGISFVILLSFLLLSYSARIDVMQRKRNMEIYRLCGATEWYIRLPYLIGGTIIGLMGSIIGLLMFYVLKTAFQGVVIHFSSVFVSSFNYAEMPFFVFAILALLGPFIGVLGHLFAFIALRYNERAETL